MEETQWPLSGGWPEPVAPDVHVGVEYTRHVQAKCRRRGVEDTGGVSIKQTLKIRVLFFNYSNIKNKRSFRPEGGGKIDNQDNINANKNTGNE